MLKLNCPRVVGEMCHAVLCLCIVCDVSLSAMSHSQLPFPLVSRTLILYPPSRRRRKCHRDNTLPLMTPRDPGERARDSKDLDSAYPALLTDVDGQGRVTKHFCDYSGDYVSQHTLRHMGTTNTISREHCEHALHPLPDATRLQDPDAVNNAINQLNEQATLGRKDPTEGNQYPPGMRTPQQGEPPTLYFQLDTKGGVRHLHGHACVPVCSHHTDGRHIACLPDNNFD